MGHMNLDVLTEPAPAPGPADWNDDGVVIMPKAVDGVLLDAYEREWMRANGFTGLHDDGRLHYSDEPMNTCFVISADRPDGWNYCTPYVDHAAVRELCCAASIASKLEELLGEPAGVHLNLTGWRSTLRDWHQDGYLNPPGVGDSYAAVWIALGPISPDSGPFQYVPGSHRWHRLMKDKITRFVDPLDPQWPKHTETFLSPLVKSEIVARGAEVVTYLPERGDVLIWHPRLYHRGSAPAVPSAYRPAMIAHYSGIHHRPDFPRAVHAGNGWMFPIREHTPLR